MAKERLNGIQALSQLSYSPTAEGILPKRAASVNIFL